MQRPRQPVSRCHARHHETLGALHRRNRPPWLERRPVRRLQHASQQGLRGLTTLKRSRSLRQHAPVTAQSHDGARRKNVRIRLQERRWSRHPQRMWPGLAFSLRLHTHHNAGTHGHRARPHLIGQLNGQAQQRQAIQQHRLPRHPEFCSGATGRKRHARGNRLITWAPLYRGCMRYNPLHHQGVSAVQQGAGLRHVAKIARVTGLINQQLGLNYFITLKRCILKGHQTQSTIAKRFRRWVLSKKCCH